MHTLRWGQVGGRPRSHPARKFFLWVAWLGAFGLASILTAFADQAEEGHSLALNVENDGPTGRDRHYTAGVHLSYLSADNAMPRWLRRFSDWLPAPGLRPAAHKFGLEIGQEFFTPELLSASEVVANDRPYAGWLYLGASLRRRGPGWGARPAMETVRLDLGVVGPSAFGQQTQAIAHEDEPKGWDNQLDDEFGVALRYEQRYLFAARGEGGWGADFIPAAHFSLGNVDTHVGLNLQVRGGFNVPNEFETPAQRTPPRWGAYLFAGADGRVVGRNIFLDGNTFQDSHHVDKQLFVADLRAGLVLVLKRVELLAAIDWRTPEFEEQNSWDTFASATVRYRF